MQRRLVSTRPLAVSQHDVLRQRLADQRGATEPFGIGHRQPSVVPRVVVAARHGADPREQEVGPNPKGEVVDGIVDGSNEQRSGADVVVFGDANHAQQKVRRGAQGSRPEAIDRGLEDGPGLTTVARQDVLFGGVQSPGRGVAAETDGQVVEIGGGGGPPRHGGIRGSVECGQSLGFGGCGAECHVSGLQLGLHLDGRQGPVHSAAPGGTGVGVDTLRQQRMRKNHPIAVDPDDVFTFRDVEQLYHPLRRHAGGVQQAGPPWRPGHSRPPAICRRPRRRSVRSAT